MDKPKKEKTITIKINGENRSYLETKAQNEEKVQIDEISKEKPIKIKQVDYSSELEAAATKESEEDDSFDWFLHEETADTDIISEYKIVEQPKKRKKSNSTLISDVLIKNKRNLLLSPLVIVVLFAIIVGTSFGLIFLKLVTTEKIVETAAEPVNAQPKNSDGKQAIVEKLQLEPLSTFVIQGGVFSNIEAAKQLQTENTKKGVPSQIVKKDGQAFLFLSVADSLEHAKEIGTQLSNKGVEVFAKSLIINEKSFEELQPEEKKLLEGVHTFYEILATSVSEGAITAKIPESLIESAEKQFSTVKGIEASQLKNEGIIVMKDELEKAMEQLNSYKQTATPEALNKIQQHLLAFLAAYEQLD
ncbi:hypothetical protein KDN24_07680 [Bacillus sp. Bva_UNVM-123]|uniref:hypothetical protein n=1 Tax=Bacillus sp. Bva_UNVM-123 TaxID=2829798 RepID=UPI00391FA63C